MGVAAGLLAAGTIVSAGGALLEGYKGKQAYDYNAAVARQEARYATQRATIEEEQFRRQLDAKVARQRVLQGMSGTTGGSNIDALERTIREGEYDAQLIRYGGSVDAWRADSAKELYDTRADTMMFAGVFNAGSTLLTGSSKFDWRAANPTAPDFSSNWKQKPWEYRKAVR